MSPDSKNALLKIGYAVTAVLILLPPIHWFVSWPHFHGLVPLSVLYLLFSSGLAVVVIVAAWQASK